MNLMKFNAIAILIILFPTASYPSEPDARNFDVYRNAEYQFSFWYPKSWAPVPVTHGETRIKVVSNQGKGGDDCNVVAISRDMFKGLTPEEYIKDMNSLDLEVMYREQYPDYKIIERGRSNLSNHDAHYMISIMTMRMFGISVPNKQLQVSTVDNGVQYIITCRTEPDRFDEMLSVFKIIMAGFVIKPSL